MKKVIRKRLPSDGSAARRAAPEPAAEERTDPQFQLREQRASGGELGELLSLMFQAHPWHGVPAIPPGSRAADRVNAYVEIVPADVVKYEVDKPSGKLRLDRPHRYAVQCPTLYGFVPQTYCGDAVAERCMARTERTHIEGDGDPLDICILSEKPFSHGDFLVHALVVGGLRMIEAGQADDKIIAVLEKDVGYGHMSEIDDVPTGLVDRLRHYFLTYKQFPEEAPRRVEIAEVYDRAEALEVIRRSQEDYRGKFGAPEQRVEQLVKLLAR